MTSQYNHLVEKIRKVTSIDQFEDWSRFELRRILPHAALLVTLGKLYGVGSVPTHRLSIDYPLEMVESLKNTSGALNDPLMYGWFKNGRVRYVDISGIREGGPQESWRKTCLDYGIAGVMIHGVLDHVLRRFAVFQWCNPHSGGAIENAVLASSLVQDMSEVIWGVLGGKNYTRVADCVGNPTLNLTAAELHIVELIAQGLSNKEIARRRGVSDSTVKTQVQRTGAKLGVTRRAEIVAIAMPMLSPLPPQTLLDYDDDDGF